MSMVTEVTKKVNHTTVKRMVMIMVKRMTKKIVKRKHTVMIIIMIMVKGMTKRIVKIVKRKATVRTASKEPLSMLQTVLLT
jgi:hypothetical protein